MFIHAFENVANLTSLKISINYSTEIQIICISVETKLSLMGYNLTIRV